MIFHADLDTILINVYVIVLLFRITADEGAIGTKYFHMSALALMALVPTAIAYSPSSLNTPVDLLLGLVIPFHSHVGMNGVVSDYVPKAYRTLARSSVLGATVLMTLGFLRLNISGPGITETVKSLWRKTTKK